METTCENQLCKTLAPAQYDITVEGQGYIKVCEICYEDIKMELSDGTDWEN